MAAAIFPFHTTQRVYELTRRNININKHEHCECVSLRVYRKLLVVLLVVTQNGRKKDIPAYVISIRSNALVVLTQYNIRYMCIIVFYIILQ
jgi:hypothetical protein